LPLPVGGPFLKVNFQFWGSSLPFPHPKPLLFSWPFPSVYRVLKVFAYLLDDRIHFPPPPPFPPDPLGFPGLGLINGGIFLFCTAAGFCRSSSFSAGRLVFLLPPTHTLCLLSIAFREPIGKSWNPLPMESPPRWDPGFLLLVFFFRGTFSQTRLFLAGANPFPLLSGQALLCFSAPPPSPPLHVGDARFSCPALFRLLS